MHGTEAGSHREDEDCGGIMGKGKGGEIKLLSAQIDNSNNIKGPPVSSGTHNTQSNELKQVSPLEGRSTHFPFCWLRSKKWRRTGRMHSAI